MERSAQNVKLCELAVRISQILGFPVKEDMRYDVSDANFIFACGAPVLDGLGPVGGEAHSKKEYMVKESLKQRIALLSALLSNLDLIES